MEKDQAETSAQGALAAPVSTYPALSISKPPARRDRVMTFVLSGLLAAAFGLAVAGMVAHYLQ